jgi:hypothetical protein
LTYIKFVVIIETWRWEFYAFVSKAEGCPVQSWFDGLPQEDKEEIVDLLDRVRNTTSRPWPERIYDPLKGEGGISEIKVENLTREREGKVEEITYRIYGFFGPKHLEHSYTFLHGTEKSVKNDRTGKAIAKGRFDEIERGTAGVQKFNHTRRPVSAVKEEPRRPN